MTEYILTGHSEDIDKTFRVPHNMTIIFYANEGQKCIITDSVPGLNYILGQMRYHAPPENVFFQNSICKNYLIDGFDNSNMIYLYYIENGEYIPVEENMEGQSISLENIARYVRNNTDINSEVFLYCGFCRGNDSADEGDIFNYDQDAFNIGDNEYDYGEAQYQDDNIDGDFFNDMDFMGGVKINTNNVTNKKSRRKLKTKRTIRTKINKKHKKHNKLRTKRRKLRTK